MLGERENDRTLACNNDVSHITEDQKFFGSFASVVFSVIVSMSERRVTHTTGSQDHRLNTFRGPSAKLFIAFAKTDRDSFLFMSETHSREDRTHCIITIVDAV